jgi:hypothetical protein
LNRVLIDCAVLFGVASMCIAEPLFAQKDEAVARQHPLLEYSIVGSSSCDNKPCYSEIMSSIPVQQFLLDLAKGPRQVRAADAAAERTNVSIADLLALRLIRRDGDQYFLNFALFTAADVKRIREVSERYAGSLAGALLARHEEIATALRVYDAPGVDPKAVAYFLLGCASLDWEGLNLTARKGYRKATEEKPDGNYVPFAQEITEVSLEKIYWGSHNSSHDGVSLTSFGDHHSSPRYMLPDLLWQIPKLPPSYPDTLKAALRELMAESLDRIGYQLGRMMLALRDTQKSGTELARAAGAKENEAKALLRTLVALDYVVEQKGRYRAQIPVLTKRDEAMARKILAIGNQVMEQWLSENYESIRAELKDLSFMRSGVPFSEGFTMIWHYLFGITNRKLVEAGLFADPYETTRKYKGAIPVVYELKLGWGTS